MPKRPLLPVAAWRSAGEPPDALVSATFAPRIKAVPGDDRALQFVISDESVDRDKDRIAADGWELDAFRRNPVVLFGHDYRSLPVARATAIGVVDRQLVSVAHFCEPEVDGGRGDQVLKLYQGGYLGAVSVGFAPLEWT